MDQADFVHMVRISEHASADNSRAYRRSVAAFAALGYAWVLVAVGFVRELLGNGTLLGLRVIPECIYASNGGFYVNNGMMTMPAMALILLGCLIWALRAINKEA